MFTFFAVQAKISWLQILPGIQHSRLPPYFNCMVKLNVNIEFLKITTSEPLPLQHECDHEILEISTQEILHNVTRIRN